MVACAFCGYSRSVLHLAFGIAFGLALLDLATWRPHLTVLIVSGMVVWFCIMGLARRRGSA